MNTDDIVEFVMDPLRLTLIIAGIVVVLAILILGRRSRNQRDMLYRTPSRKEYSFNSMPDDRLVDEEVIVLPRRKKESEVAPESTPHFSANYDEQGSEQVSISSLLKNDLPLPGDENRASFEDKDNDQDKVKDQNKVKNIVNAQETKNLHQEAPVQRAQTPPPAQRPAPKKVLPKLNIVEEVIEEIVPAPAATPTPKKPAPIPQQFVVLHIIAAEDRTFTGQAIFQASQALGMAMGKYNVFHYPADSAYKGDSAFCMTNMSAEGNFDVEHLGDIQTNGVSLILTLPTMYSDGVTVFSNMLAVAQALSKRLGGDIIDQTRMPLTAALVTSMRADIEKYESRLPKHDPVLEV